MLSLETPGDKQAASSISALAVETRGLGRRYGSQWAVQDLNLQVPRGAVYGFLGLNGAGKTTTLRMLLGLLAPHAGSMSVLGFDPVRDDIAVKRRVGYVPDTPTFYEWMTVRETLAFIQHHRPREWDDALALRLATSFDLPLSQKAGSLSRGQRAKLALVHALAFNPDLLLLDEPTLGLDPLARRQFTEGLLAEYMDGNRTVIISSHLIQEIAGVVDYVGIIRKSHLVSSERTEDLLTRVKRVRLQFEDAAPGFYASVPHIIEVRVDGREALLTLDRFNPEAVRAALQAYNPKSLMIEDLGLEEAFVALSGSTPVESQS